MRRVTDALMVEGWNGMKIRYEKPHVDRVWLQLENKCRLCLHKIYPIEDGEAYYHPHPWEFESYIVDGAYFTNIGYSATGEEPPVAIRMLLSEGSWYSMADRQTWHTVEPAQEPVYSIILTKKRWNIEVPETCAKNTPMRSEEISGLLRDFESRLKEKCPSLTCSLTKSPGLFEASTSLPLGS